MLFKQTLNLISFNMTLDDLSLFAQHVCLLRPVLVYLKAVFEIEPSKQDLFSRVWAYVEQHVNNVNAKKSLYFY